MIPKTIDSDAHVIEIPFTWEFMTEAERKVRALLGRAGRRLRVLGGG